MDVVRAWLFKSWRRRRSNHHKRALSWTSQAKRHVSTKARWSRLRSWCRQLKGRLSVEYTHEKSDDGLDVAMPRAQFGCLVLTLNEYAARVQPGDVRKLREAIELVGLALLLDPSAWEGVVYGLCGVDNFSPLNHLPEELVPRLCIKHMTMGLSHYNTVELYEELWTNIEQTHFSKRFWRTRAWLLKEFGGPRGRTEALSLPIRLQLAPTCMEMNLENQGAYYNRLVAFVEAYTRVNSSYAEHGLVSRLSGVELNLEGMELTDRLATLVVQVIETGIRLDHLALRLNASTTLGTQAALLDFLATQGEDTVGVLRLSDSPRAPTSATFPLLRRAQGLRHVELGTSVLDINPRRRQRRAMWLAFALMERNSPSSIQSLRITPGALGLGDIQTMVEALTAANLTGQLQSVLPSLDTNSPLARVGVNSVKQLNIRGGLRSLDLSFPPFETGIEETLRLLRLVGGNLESLALQTSRWEVQDHQIELLFQVCPKLRYLRIQRAQFQSANVFRRAFKSGSCRLQSLCLEDVGIADRRSVLELVCATNYRSNNIHHHLRHFVCDVYLKAREVEELLTILKKNSTLQHVSLRLSEPCMRNFRPQIDTVHLAPLPMRQGPLALQNKLAFLSVVQRGAAWDDDEDLPVMTYLTEDLVASIFEFAAPCVLRKVMCYGIE
ncbi:hypothetical protein Poli38472_011227 [Pythium oligandrum]|uniref:Uncharacterized protein n=1 Tax=Pythium oligandrum TaxID=41045 RepID=A0A8K1FQ59_PYTOL|nr:hypothetical protein Poli38472_011227 [Pythium oligandrum]|eukprot:TMW67607.1 hypothetical protein Poli38472_011227 [Pythium oligandrum]